MSLTDRLNGLIERLRAARSPARPSTASLSESPSRAAAGRTAPSIGRSIAATTDIRMQDAVPLNAASCVFDVHLDVTTDPGSGGYSALVPLTLSDLQDGPAVFRCDLDVRDGAVGVSAATADCRIIAERVASTPGHHRLEIIVPDPRDVGGILVRNFAMTGRPSRTIIRSIAAETWPAESFLRIRRDRPGRVLRLPLRKRLDDPLRETAAPVTTIAELDTGATAAIVVDAWQVLGDRVTQNIRDRLAPTLVALRSTGMAILHAAHDRDAHPLAGPLAGETEIPGDFHDADILAGLMADAGIRSLIYLGYFSNMCVLQRAVGMVEMQKRGFSTILVRDASAARESEESMAEGWFHKAAVHFVELNLGATTTAAEVQAAVVAMSARAGTSLSSG